MRRQLPAVLALVFLSGCAAQALMQGKGAPALEAGIKQFEEGRYPEAAKSLNAAIEQGLSSTTDLARAFKYQAFIHCVSNRTAQCRDQFTRALEANPRMDLEPSEAGHPIWGPVFRQVKARRPS
jgi:Tfp pilus assembly protein PilF